jgi:urease gamma subunit
VGLLVGATFVLVVLALFVFALRRRRAGKARGGQEVAQILEEAQEVAQVLEEDQEVAQVLEEAQEGAQVLEEAQEGVQVLEEAQEDLLDQLWAFVMAAGLIIYNYLFGRPAALLPF